MQPFLTWHLHRRLEVQLCSAELGMFLLPVDADGVTGDQRLGVAYRLSLQRRDGQDAYLIDFGEGSSAASVAHAC